MSADPRNAPRSVALSNAPHRGVGAWSSLPVRPAWERLVLVDETGREARARGMFVVRGQCRDMEGAAPYLPFVEAIEYGLTVTARDVFRTAMGESGPEIARFVPKVRGAFPDLPPPLALPSDQARHHMFESVCDFFARAAAMQPMIVVLEDLHWADELTTLMLESVARRADRSALLVIGTYRDVDLVPGHPMLRGIEHLSRLPATTRLSLKRLNASEVAEILKNFAGQEAPERLVQLVFTETEGVPFFVEEVYRHWTEERRLTDATANGGRRWRLARSRCLKLSGLSSGGESTGSARAPRES